MLLVSMLYKTLYWYPKGYFTAKNNMIGSSQARQYVPILSPIKISNRIVWWHVRLNGRNWIPGALI